MRCLIAALLCGFAMLPFDAARSQTSIKTKDYTLRQETVVEGLKEAWAMVQLPDGRILVTEKAGTLRLVDAQSQLHPDPIGGVPEVDARGQGGLLDIELHPDHARNGWIYLAYSGKGEKGSLTHLVRARFDGEKHALKDLEPVFTPPAEDYTTGAIHYGCRIEFDEKGFLYFAIGDRGDSTTPKNRAQSLGHVAGKVHRIHDDGRVPEDNPFVKTPGARPTIWSYGNRNIQGMRFQPGTGELWATEHGPRGGDELNRILKGANYGWPLVTHGINYNGTPITERTEAEGMESPVTHWTPSIAVSAIDFCTAARFPAWNGHLLVGSLAHQKLIRIVLDAQHKMVQQEILIEGGGRIRDVRCWNDGAIYVLYGSPGKIVRLLPE